MMPADTDCVNRPNCRLAAWSRFNAVAVSVAVAVRSAWRFCCLDPCAEMSETLAKSLDIEINLCADADSAVDADRSALRGGDMPADTVWVNTASRPLTALISLCADADTAVADSRLAVPEITRWMDADTANSADRSDWAILSISAAMSRSVLDSNRALANMANPAEA